MMRILTGIRRLDKMTGGFGRGDLVVIASRPGEGKTALALGLAANAVLRLDPPVATAFFSSEHSSKELMTRLIAAEARVDLREARNGFFRRGRWSDVTGAAARLSDAPLYIDDSSSLSAEDVLARCYRLQRRLARQRSRLGLVVIDQVQLLHARKVRGKGREREASQIVNCMTKLAHRLEATVIVTFQIGRGRTGGERPRLGELAGMKPFHDYAGMLSFIHRPGRGRTAGGDIERDAELIIEKVRGGRPGVCRIDFNPMLVRFEDHGTRKS